MTRVRAIVRAGPASYGGWCPHAGGHLVLPSCPDGSTGDSMSSTAAGCYCSCCSSAGTADAAAAVVAVVVAVLAIRMIIFTTVFNFAASE